LTSPSSHTLPLGGAESLLKERIRARLAEARERTLRLIAPISTENLERVHNRLMSPLVWDLGHIAAFEDLWLCGYAGGLSPLRPELMELYDAAETPRARRGDIPLLNLAEALDYLDGVRARALDVLENVDVAHGAAIYEMVLQHEHQHDETMLQCIQLADARMYSLAPSERQPSPPPGPEMIRIDAGPFLMGAGEHGFAYDNERPRHERHVDAFEIDRLPVTNVAYQAFVDDGGYRREELWIPRGWAWRRETRATGPLYWTGDGRERHFDCHDPLDPSLPVMHVSWFEADAFARWAGKRLPTEAEWEKAAAWGPCATAPRAQPWGDDPSPRDRANVDQLAFGPLGAGALAAGASAYGVLGMIGDAWEWTASDFEPYPGFRAFPYEEYSAVFFGDGYKTLRGGSWATRPSVARTTFRNWDLPQRRQIFSGFRCARDA
jgi:gamma-glutamyl hercynylcysteine S-oxide synthase